MTVSPLYEPAFKKNFEKYSGLKLNDINAKYTLVLKTRHIEGGWDIGIEGQPGIIAGEFWIVESANKNNVKAKIDLYDSKGVDLNGGDFEITMPLNLLMPARVDGQRLSF